MIFDTISSIDRHTGLGKRFQLAFEYLRDHGADASREGKHVISGDDVYALHQKYQTNPRSELQWEAHRNYADVQFVGSGHEFIGHAFTEHMKVSVPYDAENDVTMFTGEGGYINLVAGTFIVFFPQDAHMPTAAPLSGPGLVRKIVVKVRL